MQNNPFLAIEIVAGFGQIQKVAERQGLIIISLGHVHGQDLAEDESRQVVLDLIRITQPAHTFVS